METELKDVLGGIKTSVEGFGTKFAGLDKRLNDLQIQVDAIDKRGIERNGGGDVETKGLASEVFEAEQFKHFAETGRGRIAVKIADFQKKTAITGTALGSGTSGVIMPSRVPGMLEQLRAIDGELKQILATHEQPSDATGVIAELRAFADELKQLTA